MQDSYEILYGMWTLLVGLSVGSFLNVVIYRLPREESLGGRSKCPNCQKEILNRDLIPIVSQLMLRSRCRSCGEKFSWRYLIVELLTGLMYLALFLHFGLDRLPEFVTHLVTFTSLLALFVIDWETTLIPYELWIIILLAGIGYDIQQLMAGQREMMEIMTVRTSAGMSVVAAPQSIAGAVVGFVGLRAFVFLADKAFRKETMGFGDIYLTAAVGAHFGPSFKLLLYMVIAAFLGAIVGGTMMVLAKGKREDTVIPFGPFLAISTATLMLYGDPIVAGVRGFLFP